MMRSYKTTALMLLLVLAGACSDRPARFADRKPVTRVRDDAASATPRVRAFIKEFRQANAYVARELVNGMDPRRYVDALDVNSLDEVPLSSWYQPPINPLRPLVDYRKDGPPRAPFRLTTEEPTSGTPDAEVIIDARGLYYELQPDMKERLGMRTAAAAISSRLLHAIGYRTPEIHIIRSHTGERAAATRWPVGIDLGTTPITEQRGDDANDHLPHRDRRTLRALPMFTGWLGMKRVRSRILRDAYVGTSGRGHVQHFIVGLDGSLGVDDYIDAVAWVDDDDREKSNFFLRLFSAGLSPKPYATLPETPWPSVGLMNEIVLEDHYDPSPPFEPLDRMQPGDAYWAAKRLATLPPSSIVDAIEAADLPPLVEHWLFRVLHLRRADVITKGFAGTTPLEVIGFEPKRGKRAAELVLASFAVQTGIVKAKGLSYAVRYLDDEGEEVLPPKAVRGVEAVVRIPLPEPLRDRDYTVVRIWAQHGEVTAPRAFEAHIKPRAGSMSFRLLGVRH
jgi:hypothetical protein